MADALTLENPIYFLKGSRGMRLLICSALAANQLPHLASLLDIFTESKIREIRYAKDMREVC